MNDMDELELLRQRVQQLEKELAEARQVQSMDRISPIELYKMRAFLTPLKGFVRTLLDDEKEEWYTREDRREFYTILEENIDRLSDLNRVWQGGKKEALPSGLDMYWQADVDVRKIVESVVAVHQRQTNKHTLVVDFEPQQILVEADAGKLEILLDTLDCQCNQIFTGRGRSSDSRSSGTAEYRMGVWNASAASEGSRAWVE